MPNLPQYLLLLLSDIQGSKIARCMLLYAPSFDEVEGTYCFGLVRPSVLANNTLVGYFEFPKIFFSQASLSSPKSFRPSVRPSVSLFVCVSVTKIKLEL